MKKLLIAALLALSVPAHANTGVRIVVPVHDIARGETISDSDLTTVLVDAAAVMPGVTTSMDALSGMQTRRTLRAGESVRADDVRHPVVVAKGQAVTMIFSAPGVELTAMGRAMGEGGIGDIVTVQNPASFRMISGTVTAPGTVRANGAMTAPVTRLSSR